MNVRYRVDLSQIERTALRALLSGMRRASSSERRFSWPPMPGPATRRLQGASAWAAPDQVTLRSLLQSFLSLEEAGNPESAKDSVRYPCGASQFDDSMANTSPAWRAYDLYAEAPGPKQPVVCFDESPVQLIGEIRQPISARPGHLERYDYEYRRNGTVNLFVLLDVHRPSRKVKVTERRAAEDYAQCMRDLVDIHYPDAEIIRVVQTFPPAEARRILRRPEFHHTPQAR
jgi:hypothetical protein